MAEISSPMSKGLVLRQVCLVVRDLEKSMEHYQNLLGIGPWEIHNYDDSIIGDMTYHGRPAKQRFRAAFAMVGSMQLELIQPLGGDSIWGDFLKEHGEGIHHLGHVIVDNMDEMIDTLKKQGFPCLQSGRIISGELTGFRYAFVDTVATLGTIIELIKIPSGMPV